jgi:hypothetical protein
MPFLAPRAGTPQEPYRSPTGAVQEPYAESYLESPLTMRVPSIGSRRSGSLLQAQHCGVADQATRGPRLYLHDSGAPSGAGHETSLTGREAKVPRCPAGLIRVRSSDARRSPRRRHGSSHCAGGLSAHRALWRKEVDLTCRRHSVLLPVRSSARRRDPPSGGSLSTSGDQLMKAANSCSSTCFGLAPMEVAATSPPLKT